jgi:hypothetical protein
LRLNTTGRHNAANGAYALYSNTTGDFNTADGTYALYSATGTYNTALGAKAGFAVTTGSHNIHIGALNMGDVVDNGVTRIGAPGYQVRAYVAGIRGVTTAMHDAVPVLIDSKGQLGTMQSSARYKEDILPMGSASERLFGLRPVTFRYAQPFADGSKPLQYGLVAEEVAKVFPELVVYGQDGKPETVSYHLLATLLLNEVQKDHQVIQAQTERIAELEKEMSRITALEKDAARIASLEKQVARLTTLVANRGEPPVTVASR